MTDSLRNAFESGLATLPEAPQATARAVAAIADCTDEAALKAVLCRLRNREMVRIAWRNLAGWVDLEETVTTLSALAGACLDAAARVYGTVVHEARRAPGLAVSVSRVPDQYRGHGRRAAEGRVSGRRRHGRDGRMCTHPGSP